MDLTTEPPAAPWAERHPILVGLGALLVLHALLILGPLQGVTSLKGRAEPLFIGVVQLWYVLPLGVGFFFAGWRRTLKALAIGALATFLLNLAACAVFIGLLSKIGK
ncbi:MAG: hypothetical protein ABI785_02530 [Gemmatimonadales bacterium]